jgi:hypothetical protein
MDRMQVDDIRFLTDHIRLTSGWHPVGIPGIPGIPDIPEHPHASTRYGCSGWHPDVIRCHLCRCSVAEDVPQELDAPQEIGSDELNIPSSRRSNVSPTATRPITPAVSRPISPTPSQKTHSSSGGNPQLREPADVRIDVDTLKTLLALVSSEERKEIITRLAIASRSPSRSTRAGNSRPNSREERRGRSPAIPPRELLRTPGEESSLQPTPLSNTPSAADKPPKENVAGWYTTRRQSSPLEKPERRSSLADELSRAAQHATTSRLSPSGKTDRTERPVPISPPPRSKVDHPNLRPKLELGVQSDDSTSTTPRRFYKTRIIPRNLVPRRMRRDLLTPPSSYDSSVHNSEANRY